MRRLGQSRGRRTGITLVEIVLVIIAFATLLFFFSSRYKRAEKRSFVSRIKADQRSLATAIESYYVDNLSYPACDSSEPNGESGYGANNLPNSTSGLRLLPTFRQKRNSKDDLHTLTTPVAYIMSYFVDPYADTVGASYMYSTPSSTLDLDIQQGGWFTWSFGKDRDEIDIDDGRSGDIEVENYGRENVRIDPDWYNPNEKTPSDILLQFGTWDPTNGLESNGDVYRIKQ